MKNVESMQNREIINQFVAQELEPNLDDLTEFYSVFRQNDLDTDKVDLEMMRMEAQLAMEKLKHDYVERFFGIRDGDNKLVSTGSLYIDKQHPKVADFSFVSVNKNYRGKGIENIVRSRMEKEAVRLGCQEVRVAVRPDNMSSLLAFMKGNFVIKDIFFDSEDDFSFFELRKKLDGTEIGDKFVGSVGDLEEVNLSSIGKIGQMLSEGWVGIDIKNIGDVQDKKPVNWVLIMEKVI